jgi:hypothetical protein
VTEWNQILREEIYSPEEPDEYLVNFYRREEGRLLIWYAEQGDMLLT